MLLVGWESSCTLITYAYAHTDTDTCTCAYTYDCTYTYTRELLPPLVGWESSRTLDTLSMQCKHSLVLHTQVLLPPLVGWESSRTRVEGSVLVVELKMTLSQKARTIDEMLCRRKVEIQKKKYM